MSAELVEKLKEKITPKAIRMAIAGVFASSFFTYYAIDHNIVPNPFANNENASGIEESDDIRVTKIAKQDLHFIQLENDEVRNQVTLFFSYTSKPSWELFKALKAIEPRHPNTDFRYIHLNLSDTWAVAHKVKITLEKLNVTSISDNELFAFFTDKNNSNPLKNITKLLIDHEVDMLMFDDVYNSLEVTQESADHFEQYIITDISFIPDLYIEGNKQVVLGSLNSYSDIDLVLTSIQNRLHENKPKQDAEKEKQSK